MYPRTGNSTSNQIARMPWNGKLSHRSENNCVFMRDQVNIDRLITGASVKYYLPITH